MNCMIKGYDRGVVTHEGRTWPPGAGREIVNCSRELTPCGL